MISYAYSYSLPGYICIANNPTRHSGPLFLSKGYNYVLRNDLTIHHENIEIVFIEIWKLGIIYWRPHTDFRHFLDKFVDIISVVSDEKKLCCIAGDFNLDLLKYKDDATIAYCKITITKSTRVNSVSATIIDHIWSNNISNGKISDNFQVFTIYKHDLCPTHTEESINKTMLYRDYRNLGKMSSGMKFV